VLAGLAALPLQPAYASAAAGFVVLGDWGRMGGDSQAHVAAAMGDAAAEIGSRFVISTGDNFYPAGVQSVHDPHWKLSFEDIYTAPALQTPWYAALGNHDYRGVPRSQVHYTHHSERWRMPHRFYKVTEAEHGTPGLDIFVMDTSPLVQGRHEEIAQLVHGHLWKARFGRQFRWLQHELAQSTAPWKVVVGHHPIYSGSHGDTEVLVERIAPLLEQNGVQVYLNGHDHSLQHIARGGVNYVCSGAGSEASKVVAIKGTQFCAARPGFAMFALQGQSLMMAFRDLGGKTLYSTAIPRARA